jgi:hypothetical protein
LNPNPKKFEKKDPNKCGIHCSVFYIFAMMVKIGKIGSKLKKTFSRDKISKRNGYLNNFL